MLLLLLLHDRRHAALLLQPRLLRSRLQGTRVRAPYCLLLLLLLLLQRRPTVLLLHRLRLRWRQLLSILRWWLLLHRLPRLQLQDLLLRS